MTTQQFLISNFRTGFDQELQPWLLMNDAFTEMVNYRTQRGVVFPRRGITGFAQGGRGSAENEQSRIYSQTTGEAITDTNQTFTHTLANVTVRPGSVTISEDGGDSASDDGTGGFTGDFDPGATIDYCTGAISATWTNGAPTNPVVTYTHANGNPVMGIFNFIDATNTRELIVVSTDEFNRYNSVTNRFDIIPFDGGGTAASPTGTVTQFFSATMYPDKSGNPRLIMVNGDPSDGIYSYDGTDIDLLQDSGDYGDPSGVTLGSSLHVFYFNERLVLIRPIDSGGTTYPQRIYWTGINDTSGNGDDFNSVGSGFIDIPSEFFITAAVKLKSSIIIWTTENVWELTTTDSIDLPFRIRQIGDSEARGSQAPYSGITWFGESASVGQLGFVGTDGRDSFRIDNKIPFFSRDRMNGLPSSSSQKPMEFITSGTVFEDDQFWFLYPDINNVDLGIDSNTAVLAHNFVESSWSTYDLKLTRLGKFKQTTELVWDEINEDEKDEWAYWDTTTEPWDSIGRQKFDFLTLAGDRNGFIYALDDKTDQCAEIKGITQANPAVITTEPDVFEVGDRVSVTGVNGMTEINDQNYEVTAVSAGQVTIGIDASEFSAYTSGGVACRWIKREMVSKPFNPFVDQNKKCRLKRVHFFFDTNRSSMLLDLKSDRRRDAYRIDIPLDDGSDEGGAVKKWTSITVNQVANFHTLRLHQENGQANEGLHAIMLECQPVGRLYR